MSPSHRAPLIGYSERGLVNALVGVLREDPQRLREFVDAFRFTVAPKVPQSATDLLEFLDTRPAGAVAYLVETGFAQFGDPDLIVVVTAAGRRWLLFVEAKVVPYMNSAMSNDRGMKDSGFNSSINGQLSLKYRLARALAEYSAGHPPLVEPRSLHAVAAQHHSAGGVSDPLQGPRHLSKPENLERIVTRLLPPAGPATDEPLADVFFIALTREDPSTDCLPVNDQFDLRAPCYFEQEDGGAHAKRAWRHTAFCTWQALRDKVSGLKSDKDFRAVWDALVQPVARKGTGPGEAGIRTTAWSKLAGAPWTTSTRKRLNDLVESLSATAGLVRTRLEGSDSWSRDRSVVVKTMAHGSVAAPAVLVGVAGDRSVSIPPMFNEGVAINRRTFCCVRFTAPPQQEALEQLRVALEEYFDDLARAR